MTIGLLSFVGMIVFIVMSFISKVKKNGKTRKNLLIAGSCFVVMAVCASLDDTPVENQAVEKEETKEVATTEAKVEVVDNTNEDETKKKADEEAKKKETEEKLKLEEEKKKEELAKKEAEKVKAEEKKKIEAAKVAEKTAMEDELSQSLQLLIELSEGVVIDIRQSPYTSLEWQQVQVIVSDAWYESPEHEKERFAENVSGLVEAAIYQSGLVKSDQSILTDFIDSYDKELASEKVFGGYKIKR